MAKQKAKENRKAHVTEGRRLLRELEGSNAGIAEKLGCSKALVGHWRLGTRLPSDAHKEKMELLFGIPRRSWDVKPNAKLHTSTPSTVVLTRATSEEGGDDTMRITTGQINTILMTLKGDELTDSAAAKMRDTLQKLLALRARMERDRDLLEDKVVREHPEWVRIKAVIVAALKPYPEAAKAIAEVLK